MGTLLPTIFIPQSELLSTCWVSWIASLSLSICCADLSPYAEARSDKCGLLTQENEASSDFEDTVLVLGHHHTLQPLLNVQRGFFL